ncbi:hypothetical protein LXL04_031726 [Taraxacum kok-saghyz]
MLQHLIQQILVHENSRGGGTRLDLLVHLPVVEIYSKKIQMGSTLDNIVAKHVLSLPYTLDELSRSFTLDKSVGFLQKSLAIDHNNQTVEISDKDEEADFEIYFCSRTHSQHSQFVKELKKSSFASDLKVARLGSRKNFCINEYSRFTYHSSKSIVQSKPSKLSTMLGSLADIVDKELTLVMLKSIETVRRDNCWLVKNPCLPNPYPIPRIVFTEPLSYTEDSVYRTPILYRG